MAVVEGARGVLQGTDQVIAGGRPSANVDSEYRFYSAWYCVLGIVLLRAGRRPEAATTTVRATGAGFLMAACGRVLPMRCRGQPHPTQKILMGLEFGIPAVIVPWQAAVARGTGSSRGGSVA